MGAFGDTTGELLVGSLVATGSITAESVVMGDVEVDEDDIGTIAGLGALLGKTTVAGAVLAIPVTHRFVSKTTTGVEALTLANGIPNQVLTISLVADGGDGTLTPTTKTGFATIVFADVKDTVTLEYIDDTVGWIILGAVGIPAPPVIS